MPHANAARSSTRVPGPRPDQSASAEQDVDAPQAEAPDRTPSFLDRMTTGRPSSDVVEVRTFEGGPTMTAVRQPAGDMSDPPLNDIVVTQFRSSFRLTCSVGACRYAGRVGPRQCGLTPPGVATRIIVDDPTELRALAIPLETATRWLARDPDNALDVGLLLGALLEDSFVERAMDSLWDALTEDAVPNRLFVETASAALLARLAILAGQARSAGPHRGGLAPWQVRRATECIADNLARGVSLDELAELVGLSPFHFARSFKQSVGAPPHRYQIRLRVERACELLRTTALPVSDIAAAVGYETQQSFNRVFRQETGATPTAWRRDNRT